MSALLTDEMLALLSEMKGKKLKYLEYLSSCINDNAWNNVRLRFGRSAYEISNQYQTFDVFGYDEDSGILEVIRKEPDEPFVPYSIDADGKRFPHRYLFGETVKGVEVVREHVTLIEDDWPFDMDATIALRTAYQTLYFNKTTWLDEILGLGWGAPPDVDVLSLNPLEKSWHKTERDRQLYAVEREVLVL